MAEHSTTPTVSSVESDFVTFGAVHLDVTDRERALAFWRDLVGLQMLRDDGDVVVLGVPGRPLVVLHPGATSPLPRHTSGLYHLAIHVPTMEDFARELGRRSRRFTFAEGWARHNHLGFCGEDADPLRDALGPDYFTRKR